MIGQSQINVIALGREYKNIDNGPLMTATNSTWPEQCFFFFGLIITDFYDFFFK